MSLMTMFSTTDHGTVQMMPVIFLCEKQARNYSLGIQIMQFLAL